MDLASIRASLAARLSVVDALTVYPMAPAKPALPCAIIRLGPIDVHSTFDEGLGDVHFQVELLTSLATWDAAQTLLDGFASSGEVVDALETDGDSDGLSVLVSTIQPQTMGMYGPLEVASMIFLGDVL